jgi:hypothetical protein
VRGVTDPRSAPKVLLKVTSRYALEWFEHISEVGIVQETRVREPTHVKAVGSNPTEPSDWGAGVESQSHLVEVPAIIELLQFYTSSTKLQENVNVRAAVSPCVKLNTNLPISRWECT